MGDFEGIETYQKDDRDVQQKGAETVQEESEQTNVVHLVHGDLGNLPNESNSQVHDSADRSEVVDGNEGVHLVVGRTEQALDHGQTQGLEDNTTNLEDDTNPDELDLANGSNNDTNNDNGDVQEDLQVRRRDTKGPSREEDSDGGRSLEHLDESNREVQVGQVTTDQAQAEEDTDRHDGTHVDTASHLNRLASVENVGPASEDLGHDGRESQVVGRQNNRVACG